MADARLDTAEKIVRMTECNDAEPWDYAEGEDRIVDTLACAKRFVSAQAFLLSWQQGKVPTGWRRPRRLTDFEGKYPSHVLEKVEGIQAERIAQRNQQKTAKIHAVITAARERTSGGTPLPTPKAAGSGAGDGEGLMGEGAGSGGGGGARGKGAGVKKEDVVAVKKDLAAFSDSLMEAKRSLRSATNLAAEASLRIDALSSVVTPLS